MAKSFKSESGQTKVSCSIKVKLKNPRGGDCQLVGIIV